MLSAYEIICHFYPEDTPLRRLLILHSEKVRDKAFELLRQVRRLAPSPALAAIDERLVNDGALLHDIGIGRTHAPGILCEGTEHYICHGTIGAEMLRSFDPSLELEARICERHTGAGLTAQDILTQQLPITPVRELLPVSLEEQLVCLADKFYSKSGDPSAEKPIERVRRSMMKFGTDSMQRFDAMCALFCVK